MSKLEIDPSREGRGQNAQARENPPPPLSVFQTHLFNWRDEELRRLHGTDQSSQEDGPDNGPLSSQEEMVLNGSDHFNSVYSSGEQASVFRAWVGEPFQFVTNQTVYSYSEGGVGQEGGNSNHQPSTNMAPPPQPPAIVVTPSPQQGSRQGSSGQGITSSSHADHLTEGGDNLEVDGGSEAEADPLSDPFVLPPPTRRRSLRPMSLPVPSFLRRHMSV